MKISFVFKTERKSLTEPSEMGQLPWIVRHGAHDPVRCSLPHRVEEATEYVQPDPTWITRVEDVHLIVRVGWDGCSRVFPLVEEPPDVDDENHAEEDRPAGKGTHAPGERGTIEKEGSNGHRAYNLREPINQVVQRPRTNVKERVVIIIKFYTKSSSHYTSPDIQYIENTHARCKTNSTPRTWGRGG